MEEQLLKDKSKEELLRLIHDLKSENAGLKSDAAYKKLKASQRMLESALKRVKVKEAALKEKNAELSELQQELLTQNEELKQQQEEIFAQREFIEQRNTELETLHKEMKAQNGKLKANSRMLEKAVERVKKKELSLKEKNAELQEMHQELLTQNEELKQQQEEIFAQREHIGNSNIELQRQSEDLEVSNKKLKANTSLLEKAMERMQKKEKQIKAKNEELEAAHLELNEQHEKLANYHFATQQSIRSALSIQKAILPPKKVLDNYFTDHFVIYLPKDIVSGDFYFFAPLGEIRVVAAVDCTGHGIPGAFMSLIGYSILRRAVVEKGINEPHKVLDFLNEQLMSVLSSGRDGMDISICMIFPEGENFKVRYSGAKSRLLVAHVGQSELSEYKSDRKMIGFDRKRARDFAYSETVFDAMPGSTLYLFSDGYADQCSEKRKSFTFKRFQNELTQIKDLPFSAQEEHMAEQLKVHQGTAEQRDDIVLWGMKI